MPSDKSGGVVIINKQEYIKAAEDMLADETIYKSRRNPRTYMIDAFNKTLKLIVDSVEQGNTSLRQSLSGFRIKEKGSQNLGYAYFLPKVHKTFPPLQYRPIISLCSSPISPLAKWVAGILSPFVGSFSQAHIANSKDFITSLNEFYASNPNMIAKPMFS